MHCLRRSVHSGDQAELIMIEALSIALGASAAGVVLSVVIADEDSPINFWLNWANEWHRAGGWRAWIASPLGGCEKCTAGQMALWYSYLTRGGLDVQSVGGHVAAASWAVLFAFIIGHGYRWIRRKI